MSAKTNAQVNVLLYGDLEQDEVRAGQGGNVSSWIQIGPVTFIASPSSFEDCERLLRFAEHLEVAVDDWVSQIRRLQGHFPEPTALEHAILTGPRKEDS